MSISPVSFSSTSFQDRINMPQAYQRKEEPVAASGIAITKKPKKKSHKLLKLVVAAGAIAAGFAIGAKKGLFVSEKITNETAKKALGYCQTAGEKVLGLVTTVTTKAKEIYSNITSKAAGVVESASEKAEGTVDSLSWIEKMQLNQAEMSEKAANNKKIAEKVSGLADEALMIMKERARLI